MVEQGYSILLSDVLEKSFFRYSESEIFLLTLC